MSWGFLSSSVLFTSKVGLLSKGYLVEALQKSTDLFALPHVPSEGIDLFSALAPQRPPDVKRFRVTHALNGTHDLPEICGDGQCAVGVDERAEQRSLRHRKVLSLVNGDVRPPIAVNCGRAQRRRHLSEATLRLQLCRQSKAKKPGDPRNILRAIGAIIPFTLRIGEDLSFVHAAASSAPYPVCGF